MKGAGNFCTQIHLNLAKRNITFLNNTAGSEDQRFFGHQGAAFHETAHLPIFADKISFYPGIFTNCKLAFAQQTSIKFSIYTDGAF